MSAASTVMSTSGAPLNHRCNRDLYHRVSPVAKVITVVPDDEQIVGGVPAIGPVFRPRIQHDERIPAVVEPRVSHVHRRDAADAEVVLAAEVEAEGRLGNVETAIAPAL